MSEATIKGKLRQTGRKGPARRLRTQGLLPGIIYGKGENIPVTVEARDIKKILEVRGGVNEIISTDLEGDKKPRKVMIKDLEVHPIYDTLLHVDLFEVDLEKPIRVSVMLDYIGVPIGVKEQGGKLSINLRRLNIECMPADIPRIVEVQLAGMEVGQIWRVKDVITDDRLKVLSDPATPVVSLSMPKAEKEEVEEGLAVEGQAAAAAEGEGEKAGSDGKESK